ncbi:5-deoxy-glucuronate isomerase [Hamadaea sp. NPDC051192]|uniref:5-deoxy-glucuronate isomerase n=1 Tax=Hamadaea sp. NPDC051192 TaxID=3154940 RepID=UPI003439D8DC
MNDQHIPDGTGAEEPYRLVITPERAGWAYSGLRVLDLAPRQTHQFETGDEEMLVLPLSGGCVVRADGQEYAVDGRASVFSRVTDFVYLPCRTVAEVTSLDGGRYALPSARTTRRLEVRYGAAEDVPVELRGAGSASRQVNNFCTPASFPTDKLIAVEVLTPGGNWSSYPPHKHDEHGDDERELEEIYYFEVDREGPGYQRVYSSGPDKQIDVLAEVHSGDAVVIPFGYHGPSMAAPGYDLYYLNVMAGPAADREWLFRDDPEHAWIRDTWAAEPVDPRLPLTGAGRKQ